MSIVLAEYEDLNAIASLMQGVFEEKMQVKYSQEGRESFQELICLSALQKRFLGENLFYIKIENGFVTGVLELEKPSHIAFLFVKDTQKGVGKELCESALRECDEAICTVGAFEDSIGFYKKLGFVALDKEGISHGMPFTLMAKSLIA